jgi:tryptophanase
MGVPIMRLLGGVVYIDARLYNHILVDKYPEQALVYDLYLK